MDRIQDVIFRNILSNDEYARSVTPHLKPEYFDGEDRKVYQTIDNFVKKHNKMPTMEVVELGLDKLNLNEDEYNYFYDYIEHLKTTESKSDLDWLVKETESFCRDRALWNAIHNSAEAYESKKGVDAIPKMVEDALSVTFNSDIGVSFLNDAQKRFDAYTAVESKIPFDIDILNKATRNGIKKRTLNLVMADTNVGKSVILCYFAAMYAKMGYNVLYVSMEMDEMSVYERLDACLLDIKISDLAKTNNEDFLNRVKQYNAKAHGDIVVKQFPTGQAHVGHFRHLLNDLKRKKNFTPDIFILDYLNICKCQRYSGQAVNSYSMVKGISEEVRGLGVEFDIPIWSATQSGRGGNNSADLQLSDISESYGTAQTVDFLMAVMPFPEVENKYLCSILKSRYNQRNKYKRFALDVDYDYMRLAESDRDTQCGMHENRERIEQEERENIKVDKETGEVLALPNKSKDKKLNTSGWEF